MKKLKIAAVLAVCCFLSGCFQIQAVHYLHYYGESDTGVYRITMNSVTYAALEGDNKYAGLLKDLQKFSRPVTRYDGDFVHLEDTSGDASMEHFYDTYHCQPAPVRGFVDCHFAFNIPKDFGSLPDWSIDWEVVVQPDMRVVESNHQRTRRVNGQDHLIWFFDGNRVSSGSVDFTVRTPQGQ